MSGIDLAGIIQIGYDILTTRVSEKTKRIVAQLGNVFKEKADTDNVEWWQHVGLVSRPPKPEAKKQAAQAVVLKAGDHDIIIASSDARGLALQGQLDHGETCLYAAGDEGKAQGRVLLKKNGSINLYTRQGNTEAGAGMGIFIDPESDTISILNSKGHGIVIDADGVSVTAKGAALSLKSSGDAKLIGKGKTQVDGASVVIGSVVVPLVNAALKGTSGILGTPSIKVSIE